MIRGQPRVDLRGSDDAATAGVAALDHPASAELARHEQGGAAVQLADVRLGPSGGDFDQAARPPPKRPRIVRVGDGELDPQQVTRSPRGPRAGCGSALSLPVKTMSLTSRGVDTGEGAQPPFLDRRMQFLILASPP